MIKDVTKYIDVVNKLNATVNHVSRFDRFFKVTNDNVEDIMRLNGISVFDAYQIMNSFYSIYIENKEYLAEELRVANNNNKGFKTVLSDLLILETLFDLSGDVYLGIEEIFNLLVVEKSLLKGEYNIAFEIPIVDRILIPKKKTVKDFYSDLKEAFNNKDIKSFDIESYEEDRSDKRFIATVSEEDFLKLINNTLDIVLNEENSDAYMSFKARLQKKLAERIDMEYKNSQYLKNNSFLAFQTVLFLSLSFPTITYDKILKEVDKLIKTSLKEVKDIIKNKKEIFKKKEKELLNVLGISDYNFVRFEFGGNKVVVCYDIDKNNIKKEAYEKLKIMKKDKDVVSGSEKEEYMYIFL